MGYQIAQVSIAQVAESRLWRLAERQHGVIARRQLLDLGLSPQSIKHRISTGRLHPVWRGVYAIGRPRLSLQGRWIGAVLACGPEAVLSHESAAALWRIRPAGNGEIEVSVPVRAPRRRPGIIVHRPNALAARDFVRYHAIPVTTPVRTLIDLAPRLERGQLEAAINEADKRDLTDPEELRSTLQEVTGRPGVRVLRQTLDRRTFTLTDSELERRFLPVTCRAGLPLPQTGRYLNGFKVDFYWPDLGLVIETDGLRYHRTPAQQARDRIRDQAHAAAGLTQLRFTHAQVTFETGHVQATLAAVVRRLRAD